MARDRFRDRGRGAKGPSRRERPGSREEEAPARAAGSRRRGRAGGRGGGIDFSGLDDEPEDDRRYDDEDDERAERDDDRAPRRRPHSKRGAPRRERLSLIDLCTPVFGYAAVLPREPGDPQPPYRQFRDEVLSALKRIETEAAQQGIESSDAGQACYALCFFLDTQVAASTWNAAGEWAAEPLGIVLQQDPEGGVNFFRRLEGFGDRERAVKEVYLVCLALGYRGKFAEFEPAEQAARIGEIRQQLVRGIRNEPMDKLPVLFPEAYAEAEPIEDDVPRPPMWWLGASMAIVVVSLLVWIGLSYWAGRLPADASRAVQQAMDSRSVIAPRPDATPAAAAVDEDRP